MSELILYPPIWATIVAAVIVFSDFGRVVLFSGARWWWKLPSVILTVAALAVLVIAAAAFGTRLVLATQQAEYNELQRTGASLDPRKRLCKQRPVFHGC